MPTHSGPIVASRDGLTVIDCAACGWAHLSPLPAAAELDVYYQRDFWERDKAQWLARYEAQRDWINATNGDYLAALAAHTDGYTLLDVGCGYGFFVKAAHAMGWEAEGIDPSSSAIGYAITSGRDNSFSQAAWDDKPDWQGEFSAISAMWLMEHLPDPLAFLRWARAHLRENGALLLAVPNEWNYYQASAMELGKCLPGFFVHPTHINYWTMSTFANMLGLAVFKIVDRLATWPIDAYLSDGADYTRDEDMGIEMHANIRKQELGMGRGVRLVRHRSWAQMGVGRDQIVIAKVDQ